MAFQGWVKLHRKIMENSILWETSEPFDRRSAWMYLIMMANHEKKDIRIDNNVLTVKRGQHYTSIYKLADKWHWSRNRVDRYLGMLTEAGMLQTDRTPRGTLITIVNYEVLQGTWATDEATVEATDEATVGLLSKLPTEHKQELKNVKNEKRRKEIVPAPPCEGGEWQ